MASATPKPTVVTSGFVKTTAGTVTCSPNLERSQRQVMLRRECRRLERLMFCNEPLPDEIAEDKMLSRKEASLRIDLARMLESLPSHYLEPVLLRDFKQPVIGEIPQRLGEQPGAVKRRLHRLREPVR